MNNAIVKREDAEIQRAISTAQEAVLTQRTPPEVIKTRPGKGGMKFRYVTQAWVTEQLNLAFGWDWDWEVVEWRLFPDETEPKECMVLGRLTVRSERGTITKQQFGSCDVKRDKGGNVLSIGDDLKAASSDGLKKAASLLGLALDLYSEDVTRYEEPEPYVHTFEDVLEAGRRYGFSEETTKAILKERGKFSGFRPEYYEAMCNLLRQEHLANQEDAAKAEREMAQ